MAPDRDSLVRALGKSGAILFIGTFLEIGLSFAAKLLVARQLTSFSYGEVAVGLTVLTLGALVTRLGLHTGIARIAPRYEGRRRRGVYVSAFVLQLVGSLLLAMSLFVGADAVASVLNNRALAPVLQIIAFGIPARPLMELSIAGTQAEGRSGPRVVVQNIVHPLVRITLVVVVVVFGATPVVVAVAYVAADWIAAGVAFWFVAGSTSLLDRSLGWEPSYLELTQFSVPLMLSTGMEFLIRNTDNLMIQFFMTSADLGTYDIAYTLGQTLTIALGAFGFLFLPSVSSLHANQEWEQISHLYQLVTKWVVFITLPGFLAMFFFSELVIEITFGSQYLSGATALMIIALTYTIRAVMGPNLGLLSAVGDTRFILRANVLMAIVNMSLNIALIPRFGIVGAAVASLLSYAGLNGLYNAKLYYEYDLFPLTRSVVDPIAVYLVLFVPLVTLVQNGLSTQPVWVVLVITGVPGGLLYLGCILSFGGIQPDDVMLVNSAEDQFGVSLERIKTLARRLM